MLSQVTLKLDVELDQAVHCAGDCGSLEDLNPDVRKRWVIRTFTVPVQSLCDDRDNGEQNSNKAVLEDA